MQRYCFDKVKSTERERELRSSKRIVAVAKTTAKPWKKKKDEREGNVKKKVSFKTENNKRR